MKYLVAKKGDYWTDSTHTLITPSRFRFNQLALALGFSWEEDPHTNQTSRLAGRWAGGVMRPRGRKKKPRKMDDHPSWRIDWLAMSDATPPYFSDGPWTTGCRLHATCRKLSRKKSRATNPRGSACFRFSLFCNSLYLSVRPEYCDRSWFSGVDWAGCEMCGCSCKIR